MNNSTSSSPKTEAKSDSKSEPRILVSACLAGANCRYDCKSKTNERIKKMVERGEALPVCPEQLGGLSTPREPAEHRNGKYISLTGKDVTKEYLLGANEALQIMKTKNLEHAILKSKSPMCGVDEIYDGSFTGTLTTGDGAFTQLLKKLNISVEAVD